MSSGLYGDLKHREREKKQEFLHHDKADTERKQRKQKCVNPQ
jgi:hypothetical protein